MPNRSHRMGSLVRHDVLPAFCGSSRIASTDTRAQVIRGDRRVVRGRVVLAPYEFVQTHRDRIPIVVSRTGWSGEVGYEIVLREGSHGDALWDRVLAAGEPFQIALSGPSDAALLKVRAQGLPASSSASASGAL